MDAEDGPEDREGAVMRRVLLTLAALFSICLFLGCRPKPNPHPLSGVKLPPDPQDRVAKLPDTATLAQIGEAAMLDLADWRTYALALRLMSVTMGATPTPADPQAPQTPTQTQPSNPTTSDR